MWWLKFTREEGMIDSIRQQIKAEILKLTKVYEALGGISNTNGTKPQRRSMSKAARAKIAAAQRKRWAKQRKAA
jgi:hypothetical protein